MYVDACIHQYWLKVKGTCKNNRERVCFCGLTVYKVVPVSSILKLCATYHSSKQVKVQVSSKASVFLSFLSFDLACHWFDLCEKDRLSAVDQCGASPPIML